MEKTPDDPRYAMANARYQSNLARIKREKEEFLHKVNLIQRENRELEGIMRAVKQSILDEKALKEQYANI